MAWFQTFTDNFNRSDGALGNGWLFINDDPSNTITIVSDAAEITHPTHVQIGADAGQCYAYRPGAEVLANTRVQCLLKGINSCQVELIARKSGNLMAFASVVNGSVKIGRGHLANVSSNDTTSSVIGYNTSHDQLITLDVVGSLCTVTIVDQSDSTTHSLSYTPSSLPATGVAGFRDSGDSTTSDIDWFTVFSDTPPALSAGTAVRVANSPTSPSMSCGSASNGTGPYTYQWQRSTVSGSGYANVSGATSLSLTDSGLTPGTNYYYVLQATDSAAATALSNEIHFKTQPGDYHTVHICDVGDSIIDGFHDQFAVGPLPNMLATFNANSHYTGGADVPMNRAVSGTATADWLPTALTGYLNLTIGDIFDFGCNIALIMIGTNDSKAAAVSSATYLANMQAITAALTAVGVKVFVSYMGWLDYVAAAGAWDASSAPALAGYLTEIDALDNGSSIRRIGNAPTNLYTTVQGAPGTYLLDGVHLTTAGNSLFGVNWANDIDAILFPGSAPIKQRRKPNQGRSGTRTQN